MTYNVTMFGLHLTINPVAFTIPIGGDWNVYWYGICIAVGFMLALLYGFKYADRCNIKKDPMLDVILVTAPLAILCARAYYIIFYKEPINSIGDFFGFNHGGFSGIAIYGAVIGAAVVGAIMCKIKKIKIFDMFDLAAIGFLIGQGCGRWGNFFNQEAFGSATGSSWFGMTSENVIAQLGEGALAHPCFLYESILCFIGVVIMHRVLKTRKYSGQIALIYCVWYGGARAVIEGFRTDSLYIGVFRVSQLVSIAAVIFGTIMLIINHRKYKEKEQESNYVPLYSQDESSTAEIVVDEVVVLDEEEEIEEELPIETVVDEVVSLEEFEEIAEEEEQPVDITVDEIIEEAEDEEENTLLEIEEEHLVDEIIEELPETEEDEETELPETELAVDEIIETEDDQEDAE